MTAPIIVLGMHRSGTSCLAGLLQEAGVWFGRVPRRSRHNGRGTREHEMIVRLNDEVLADSGGRWDYPPVISIWTDKQEMRRDSLLARMEKRARGPWGFKDPRTLLTLDFWPKGQYIGTFRNPYAVARSLRNARGIDTVDGLALWAEYSKRLLAMHESYHFPLVCFDATPEVYLSSVQDAFERLNLPPASEFFLDSMRHYQSQSPTPIEPYRSIYGELLACSA